MEVFFTVFESVIVLLGIGLIGFYIIGKKIVPQQALGVLSPLVLDIALPSLIFFNIVTTFNPSETQDWWLLPLWWLFFTGILLVLTFVFRYVSQQKTRNEFSISLFFQNGIFFPIAILTGMFGESSSYLVALFLFTLFFPALFFNTYHLFFRQSNQHISIKKILNPVLIATVIALAISLFGVQNYIPGFLVSIFSLVGAIALPGIMLVIGGNIYLDFKNKGRFYFSEVAKFVVIKNVVFPLIFLLILYIIRPPYYIALLLLLQSAVPPVTAVSIFTSRAGGNQSLVNQFIVASFLLSLLSIPIMIELFSMIFPAP